MAQIAAITLNDGQATPVAKTFNPQDASSDLARWIDRSGGIAVGMPSITLSMADASVQSDPNAKTRVKMKISLPVMEVISNNTIAGYTPQPAVAFTCQAVVELIAPARSSLQNRKDLLAFTKNLLAQAVVSTAFENFERPW